MPRRPALPKDASQRAKALLDMVTGGAPKTAPAADTGKDPAAVALGRKGGLKGGVGRAKALSSKKRKEIARKAAISRWKKKG